MLDSLMRLSGTSQIEAMVIYFNKYYQVLQSFDHRRKLFKIGYYVFLYLTLFQVVRRNQKRSKNLPRVALPPVRVN